MVGTWKCPYKCMSCTPESHPEMAEQKKEEMVFVSMEASGDELSDDGRFYPRVGTEQSYLTKLEGKPKKKKNRPQGLWSDVLLEPDLPAFDHLRGFEPTGLRQQIDYNDEGVQEQAETSSLMEEKKKEPKRVFRSALPSCDYSKPLTHWMKPETINEMFGFFELPPTETLLNTQKKGQKK